MAQLTAKAKGVTFDNEVCAWIRGYEGLSPARESERGDLIAVGGLPDGSQIWAVGPKGMIVRLVDGRAQSEESGTEADLYAVWVGSADEAWAVGAQGTILRRRDGTWRPMPSGTRECLYAVWGRKARDLWVGGNEGLILQGNGSTWIRTPTRSRGPITNLVDCGRGRVCALDLAGILPNIDTSERPCHEPYGNCLHDEPAETQGNRILRWSGRRWSSPLWMGQDARHLASSGDTLWALANSGLFSRKGKTETAIPLLADSDQANARGLWFGSNGEGWVVGWRCRESEQGLLCNRGAIWRVRGSKAELMPLDPVPGPLYAIWGWRGGAVAVGERNTVMIFDGSTWKTAP